MKSGNVNFLETSGPLIAAQGFYKFFIKAENINRRVMMMLMP
jgi:hypothetical protein